MLKLTESDLSRAVVSVFFVKSSAFGSVPLARNLASEASVTGTTADGIFSVAKFTSARARRAQGQRLRAQHRAAARRGRPGRDKAIGGLGQAEDQRGRAGAHGSPVHCATTSVDGVPLLFNDIRSRKAYVLYSICAAVPSPSLVFKAVSATNPVACTRTIASPCVL